MNIKRKSLQNDFRAMGIYQKTVETYIEKKADLKILDKILYEMAIPGVKLNSSWSEGKTSIEIMKKTSLVLNKKGIDFFRDIGFYFIPLFRKYFGPDWSKAQIQPNTLVHGAWI